MEVKNVYKPEEILELIDISEIRSEIKNILTNYQNVKNLTFNAFEEIKGLYSSSISEISGKNYRKLKEEFNKLSWWKRLYTDLPLKTLSNTEKTAVLEHVSEEVLRNLGCYEDVLKGNYKCITNPCLKLVFSFESDGRILSNLRKLETLYKSVDLSSEFVIVEHRDTQDLILKLKQDKLSNGKTDG